MTQQLFTLADARRANACQDGYDRFKAALKAAHPDTDVSTIRWSIGDVAAVDFTDAIWCLRLLEDRRTIVGAIMPAVKRASAHTTDPRVHDCIAALNRWLAGDDSVDLNAAARAAYAAYAAADAAAAAADAAYAVRAATLAAAAAADSAYAAYAAYAAADAAYAAADAARAAYAAEREAQREDLIAAFPRTFGV